MKKAYIAPATKVIAFEPLQMLAASISIKVDGETVDATESYSTGRGGWSSESWTETEE